MKRGLRDESIAHRKLLKIEQIREKHIKIQFNFHRRTDRSMWGEVEKFRAWKSLEIPIGGLIKQFSVRRLSENTPPIGDTFHRLSHSGRGSSLSAFVHELLSRRKLTVVSSQQFPRNCDAEAFLKLGKREKKVNTLPMRMQRALGSRPYYSQS